MNADFSFLFNYIYDHFGAEYIWEIFYVLNLIFGIISYKLGFARKLPVGKSVVVYILLAIGTIIMTFFSVLFRMPITESLIIVALVMGVYRFRLHRERKNRTDT
ncbi:putative membrane protein YlaH [Lentibacillus sp. JNUCC-1]|uniref:YlaH-like family protein n=1 Tax=Lentibacillus sp. JNUCC-1 TaxID=2654513 RepID=UPI0012E963B4|nr:YlaH-like family protein [Lentibacillus sp. JNUCC-1]MUV36261.1 putative membrane protein YlaH [Lentibacillus sp. JNUCC-1]